MNEPSECDFGFDALAARARLAPRARRALAFCGTLVLAVSAKVQVPFYPVPMTLQTLAVLALGAAFGARLAAATVALYLGEGLVGLPVFAGALAGPAYMAGPTGGYLAGFLVAAALVGWLAERGWDRAWPPPLAAMTLGHAVIFACGFAWLALALGADKGLGGRRRAVLRGDAGQDAARRGAGRRRLGRPCAPARERRLTGAGRPGAAAERAQPLGRDAFARFVPLTTRWSDNDPYGHLNNVVYYAFFDAAVNAILIEAGLLDPAASPVIGLVAKAAAASFPASLSPTRSRSASRWSISGGRRCAISWRRSRPARRAPARRAATPMSMSSARRAGRRRSPRRTGG